MKDLAGPARGRPPYPTTRGGQMEKTQAGARALKYAGLATLLGLACLTMLVLGIQSALSQNQLFNLAVKIKRHFVPPQTLSFGHTHTQSNALDQLVSDSSKVPVPAPVLTDRSMVAFAFGQSNSANSIGERQQAATGKVFNYFEGRYYKAADPLLGATGRGGSLWTTLANKLISQEMADQVVLMSAGVGGSSVAQWRKGGNLNGMLEARLQDAQKQGLNVTHFFWHQGEIDNNNAYRDYEAGLTEIIQLTQRYFPNARFFVAQASAFCPLPSSREILDSQRAVTRLKNVYLGPNTDLIGPEDRSDGCHLSGRGAEKVASEWVELIRHPQKAAGSVVQS
ncbi:sialate O-acetylesterase [Herbaspirillum huttiense]|uniref:sialate O-acetylesterase n=2 Tax=Herbaspirillum TaxID=963 RepID=UPI003CE8CE0A